MTFNLQCFGVYYRHLVIQILFILVRLLACASLQDPSQQAGGALGQLTIDILTV